MIPGASLAGLLANQISPLERGESSMGGDTVIVENDFYEILLHFYSLNCQS